MTAKVEALSRSLERQIKGALEPAPFKLIAAADFDTLPKLEWCIHGLLPTTGCAAIFGPKGTAKSFLEIDMIAALAEGRRWFGYPTKKLKRIVVVVLEGEAGFRRRVRAWEEHNGQPFPSNVLFVFQPFRIMNADDVLALAAAIDSAGGADLIVIDTLNRSAPDADENSSKDMGRILEGTRELQSMTGGMVVLVHHTGKDHSKGLRGHSSLGGALDTCIETIRSAGGREWVIEKNKDGEDGKAHRFRLELVDLGEDANGEPITSCVVAPDDAAPMHRARPPTGKNQKIVYDALAPLFRGTPYMGKAGAPPMRPCITLDDAVEGVREHIPAESKRRSARAQEAITGLVAGGQLGCNEGWLWLS